MFARYALIAVLGVIALGGYFMFNNALKQAAKEATLKCELAHKNQAIEAAANGRLVRDEII